jgi:hypothetical protein
VLWDAEPRNTVLAKTGRNLAVNLESAVFSGWLAVSTEVEKSPLLEAATQQRLLKTTGLEELVSAVMICKVYRLVRVL